MYSVHADLTGKLTNGQKYKSAGIRSTHRTEEDGGNFALADANDQQAHEFAAWFAQEFHRTFFADIQLPPLSTIFLGPDPLVFACTEYGEMLHCTPNSGFSADVTLFPTNPLHSLAITWPLPEAAGAGKDGLGPRTCPWFVPPEVLKQLNEDLRDDKSPVRRISSWPVERTFVYLDISDFSKYPPRQEALIINSLVALLMPHDLWEADGSLWLHLASEAMLCIGDGYIFVFSNALAGTRFAAHLAGLIETLRARGKFAVPFHFRIGVHTGEVYSFWDIGRNHWNYIGDGINGGNRVLAAVGKDTDDVIYISGQARDKLQALDDDRAGPVLRHLHNRGRKADKHGNPWRVYELSHMPVCHETAVFMQGLPERYQ